MRRIFLGLAAAILALTVAGSAQAASRVRTTFRHEAPRHIHREAIRHAPIVHRWGKRVWNPVYHRYHYWDTALNCYFYYDAASADYIRCP